MQSNHNRLLRLAGKRGWLFALCCVNNWHRRQKTQSPLCSVLHPPPSQHYRLWDRTGWWKL